MIVELIGAALCERNGFCLLDSVSFTIRQYLIRKVVMDFVDVIAPVARVQVGANSEGKVETYSLGLKLSLEVQISHLYRLSYVRESSGDEYCHFVKRQG